MRAILKQLKRSLLSWLSNIRIYKGGIILFGDSSYAIKGYHVRSILDILKPGDVLLRRYDHYLGSIAIPGYWSHAAIYIGDNEVIHILGKGIVREDILNFVRTDDIMVLRLRNPDEQRINLAIKKAKDYYRQRIIYDYDFDYSTDHKMYCTELVSKCFGGLLFFERMSDRYLLPDDFLVSEFNVEWTKV